MGIRRDIPLPVDYLREAPKVIEDIRRLVGRDQTPNLSAHRRRRLRSRSPAHIIHEGSPRNRAERVPHEAYLVHRAELARLAGKDKAAEAVAEIFGWDAARIKQEAEAYRRYLQEMHGIRSA